MPIYNESDDILRRNIQEWDQEQLYAAAQEFGLPLSTGNLREAVLPHLRARQERTAQQRGEEWMQRRAGSTMPQPIPGDVWRTPGGQQTPLQGQSSFYAWAAGERGMTAPFVDRVMEQYGLSEAPIAQKRQMIERFSRARGGGTAIEGRYGDVSPYTAQSSTVGAHQILAQGRSYSDIYKVEKDQLVTSQRAAPGEIVSAMPGMVQDPAGQYVMGATIPQRKIGKSLALGRQQYQVYGRGPGVEEPQLANITAEGASTPEWVQRVGKAFVSLSTVTPEGQGGYDPQAITGFGRILSKTVEVESKTELMLQQGQVFDPKQGPIKAFEGHVGFDIAGKDYSSAQVLSVGTYTQPSPKGERTFANVQFWGEAGDTPAMKAYGTKQQDVAMPGLSQQLGVSQLWSETRDIFRLGASVASVATPEEQESIWGSPFEKNQRYDLPMALKFQEYAASKVEERSISQLYSLDDPSVATKMEIGQLQRVQAPEGQQVPEGYMWGQEKVIGMELPVAAQWTGGWGTGTQRMNIETSEIMERSHPELMEAYRGMGKEQYGAPAEMFKAYAANLGQEGMLETVGMQDILAQEMPIKANVLQRLQEAGISEGDKGYRSEYQREMLRAIGQQFPGKGLRMQAGDVGGTLPAPEAMLAYTANQRQGSYLSDIVRSTAGLIESQMAQAGGITRIFGEEGEEIDPGKMTPEQLQERAQAWQQQTLKSALVGQEAVTDESGALIQKERQGLEQIVSAGAFRAKALGTPTSGGTVGAPTAAVTGLPANRWTGGAGILKESLLTRGFSEEEATGVAAQVASGEIEGPRVLTERNPVLTEDHPVLSYMGEQEYSELGLGSAKQYREAFGKTVGIAPLAGQAGGGDFDWDTYLKRMATVYEADRGGGVKVTHLAKASTAEEVRDIALAHGAQEVQSYQEKVEAAPRTVEQARELVGGARLTMSPEEVLTSARSVQESKARTGSIYNLTYRDVQQMLPQETEQLKRVRGELGALDLTAIDALKQSPEFKQLLAYAGGASLASGGAPTGEGGGTLFGTGMGLMLQASQTIMQDPSLSEETRSAMLFNPAGEFEGKTQEEVTTAFQAVQAAVQAGDLPGVVEAVKPFTGGGSLEEWAKTMPFPGNIAQRAALRGEREGGEVTPTRSGTGARVYTPTEEETRLAREGERMKGLRTALGARTDVVPEKAFSSLMTSARPGHVAQVQRFLAQAGIPAEQQAQVLEQMQAAGTQESAPASRTVGLMESVAPGSALEFGKTADTYDEDVEYATTTPLPMGGQGGGGRLPPTAPPPAAPPAGDDPDDDDWSDIPTLDDVEEIPFGSAAEAATPVRRRPVTPQQTEQARRGQAATGPAVTPQQAMFSGIVQQVLGGAGAEGNITVGMAGGKAWVATTKPVTGAQVSRLGEINQRFQQWRQLVAPKIAAGQELSRSEISLTNAMGGLAEEYKDIERSIGVSTAENVDPVIHAQAKAARGELEGQSFSGAVGAGLQAVERQGFAAKATAVSTEQAPELSSRGMAFLNQATQQQLQGVQGVGPARAQGVAAQRAQLSNLQNVGGFTDVSQLAQVSGISASGAQGMVSSIEQESAWWAAGGRENVNALQTQLQQAGMTTPAGQRRSGRAGASALSAFRSNVEALSRAKVDVSQYQPFLESAGAAEHIAGKEDAAQALEVRTKTSAEMLELFTKRVVESTEKLGDLGEQLDDIKEIAGTRDLTKAEARAVRSASRMARQLATGAAAGEEYNMPVGQAEMAKVEARRYQERVADIQRGQVERGEAQEAFMETGRGKMLGRAAGLYRGVTSGWTMMQMRRLWGMTGGQAMGAIPQAGQAEQAAYMAASTGVPMGQTTMSPLAQNIMTTQAQQANARTQMGRAAYGAWGWAQEAAGNRDLATLGGIALPGIGIGAMAGTLAAAGGAGSMAAGLGGAMGMTGTTAIAAGSAAIALPIALTFAAFATGQYITTAQSDKERMAIAAASGPKDRGFTGWLDYQAAQAQQGGWTPNRGISQFLPSWEQGQPMAEEAQEQYGERLMQGDLSIFEEGDVSARTAALKYQVEEVATKKGGPLEAFEGGAVSQALRQWTTFTGDQNIGEIVQDPSFRVAMERGLDLGQIAAGASGGPQGFKRELDRMLSVSEAQAPQMEYIAGQWGGMEGFGIEGARIKDMAYAEQLPQMDAMGQQSMRRAMGGSATWWSQAGMDLGESKWITADPTTGMGVGTNWGGEVLGERLGQTGAPGQNIDVKGGNITFNVTGQTIGFNEWDIQDYSVSQGRQQEDWQMQFKQAGMDLQGSYVTGQGGQFQGRGQWQLEDEARSMARAQQWQSFGFQREGMAQGDRQFREQWQMNWDQLGIQEDWWKEDFGTQNERRQTQFGWQLEDLAYRGAQSTLQYGWQMEDFAESERFATGRQRRQVQRKKERASIQYGMGMGQLETQEGRIRTRMGWGDEDQAKNEERHAQRLEWQQEEMMMRLRHHEEDLDLATRRQDATEEYYKAQSDLQDRQTDASREYWTLQQERQQEAFDKEKEYKELVREVQDAQLALSRAQQLQMSEWRAAWEEGGPMRRVFNDFLGYLVAEVGKAQSSRSGLYLPDAVSSGSSYRSSGRGQIGDR